MNEVKKPKKPLIFYYAIVLGILLLFNLFAMPSFLERKITEVDYGTFMSMTAEKNIGRVEVKENKILFTDKAEKNIYETGIMDDPGSFSGREISPIPQRGPDARNLMSFAILKRSAARALSAPWVKTAAFLDARAENLFSALKKLCPQISESSFAVFSPKSFGELSPVPTAVPPSGRRRRKSSEASIIFPDSETEALQDETS
jgi:hypothetical protein